jgi:hypothetical protein
MKLFKQALAVIMAATCSSEPFTFPDKMKNYTSYPNAISTWVCLIIAFYPVKGINEFDSISDTIKPMGESVKSVLQSYH